MSETTDRRPLLAPAASVRRLSLAVVTTAYVVVGAALGWSRLVKLDKSFWFDELYFVGHFVRNGPGEILAGPNLSHELYGVLDWATAEVVGESELAFRLWSVVPFILAVTGVAVWLHRRVGPVAGLAFVFLATVSPLLLDITRQARGYGLAFAAMCALTIAALEADRSGETRPVAAMCVAGVVGTCTLPQFGIGFMAVGAVLLADRRLRRPVAIGLVASLAAIVAWYAPHLHQVQAASQIHDGLKIQTEWLLTAPIDQILLPALIWIDGTAAVPGLALLPFVVLALLVMASSPFARERQSLLLLAAGPAATVIVLWIARAYVIPRYVSFLLVPLFVLLASGASAIFARISARPPILRSLLCLVVVAVLTVRFATIAPDVVGLPREANRDVAELIARASPKPPVLAYMRHPGNLVFYLKRPVRELQAENVADDVCGADDPVFYVMQPFALEDVSVPCLSRPGVQHYRFRQYARGGEMNVWFVPPMVS